MTGERDGGKSGLSQEMLNIHGNHSEQKDVDSPYSVAAGSMNTEAKFGKGVSKTTYPIEISEFGTIESYGRNENLVEIIKTAIEGLIVRRGRDGGRYDAPFASSSPFILNGNPFISRKGEIIKRLHVARFSEEDRHDRSPKSSFNIFKDSNGHKIKILGDWTMRWILEHKEEELLSGKYTVYEIGKWAIHKFYESVGKDVPEWLTRWIIDTALEELDIDDESLIRSILYNHVHKTIRDNGRILQTEENGKLTLEQRVGLCLDYELWSWIRNLKNETGYYYIDTSVLELFTYRLPDLTFKKFAEKIGMNTSLDRNGRTVIKCSKADIMKFIEGDLEVDATHSVIGTGAS